MFLQPLWSLCRNWVYPANPAAPLRCQVPCLKGVTGTPATTMTWLRPFFASKLQSVRMSHAKNKRSRYQHLSALYLCRVPQVEVFTLKNIRCQITIRYFESDNLVLLTCHPVWTFHIPGAARSQRSNSTPSQSLGVGFQLVAEDRNQDSQEHIGAYLMGAEYSPFGVDIIVNLGSWINKTWHGSSYPIPLGGSSH